MPPTNINEHVRTQRYVTPMLTPTPNDTPDADTEPSTANDMNSSTDSETAPAQNKRFPSFLVIEGLDPNKTLRRANGTILDKTIDGATSVTTKREWMGKSVLVEVNYEAYSTNLLEAYPDWWYACQGLGPPESELRQGRGQVSTSRPGPYKRRLGPRFKRIKAQPWPAPGERCQQGYHNQGWQEGANRNLFPDLWCPNSTRAHLSWNMLKHLPEDTLKILKEILNKIWISADFPQQWRAATVIPIPKPNKDHTDPLSYRPIALTSCLCKVLERMINTRLIWYLEKYRILDRSQCGFRKHRSTTDYLVSFERYLWDAFAQKQQAVGLFFDLEKAYETSWQYGIIWELHRIGLRGRLPVFVSEYLWDRRIWVRIGTKLSDEFYPEEGVPTGGVLAVTCFGLKINELPSCIAKDIFKALFVDDLAICFWGRSLGTIDIYSRQYMP